MDIILPPNENDYVNAQFFMMNSQTPWLKRWNKLQRILFIFLMLTAGTLFMLTYSFSGDNSVLVLGISAFLLALTYPYIQRHTYKRVFRKHFATVKEEGETHVLIDENEVKMILPRLWSGLKTSDILAIFETEEYFYIKIGYASILSIPKRSLADVEAAKAELKGYAEKYSFPYEG